MPDRWWGGRGEGMRRLRRRGGAAGGTGRWGFGGPERGGPGRRRGRRATGPTPMKGSRVGGWGTSRRGRRTARTAGQPPGQRTPTSREGANGRLGGTSRPQGASRWATTRPRAPTVRGRATGGRVGNSSQPQDTRRAPLGNHQSDGPPPRAGGQRVGGWVTRHSRKAHDARRRTTTRAPAPTPRGGARGGRVGEGEVREGQRVARSSLMARRRASRWVRRIWASW